MASKLLAQIQALSFFTYQDRSSEEMIQINNRLNITSGNWSAVKEQFIEERYSMREQEAWSRAEWAKLEKKDLEKIDFSEYKDRQALKDKYSIVLSNIISGRIKSNEQQLSFKWIGGKKQLKKLFDELNGKFIKATWKEFQQLFNEQEVKSIKTIQWHAKQWELIFLIDELSNHLKLIQTNAIDVKIVGCFTNEKGEPFKFNSVKTQKSAAKNSMAGSPIKEKNLKSILDAVKQARE